MKKYLYLVWAAIGLLMFIFCIGISDTPWYHFKTKLAKGDTHQKIDIPFVDQEKTTSAELECFTEGKVGMMDITGNLVIPMCFDNISSFSEGIALVQVNDEVPSDLNHVSSEAIKWGFINIQGEFVIPPSLDFFQISKDYFHFSEGLVPIREGRNGKFGYVNTTGEVVIKPQFKRAKLFTDGLAAVYVDGEGYGYINRVGEMVINPQFNEASSFKEGIAVVRSKVFDADYPHQSAYSLIDQEGNYLVPPRIDMMYGQEVNNHNSIIERYQSYGTFGKDNLLTVRVPVSEDDNLSIPPNVGPSGIKGSLGWGKWGYVKKTGGYAISSQYWLAGNFEDGYAVVEIAPRDTNYPDKLWGQKVLIDTEGRIVALWSFLSDIKSEEDLSSLGSEETINTEHPFHGPFSKEHYLNSSPDRRFLASANVNLLSNGKRDYLPGTEYFHYGLSVAARSTSNPKVGYVNTQGTFVIEPQFDEASQFFANGTAVVGLKTDDRQTLWGLIDYTGNYLIEPQSKRIFICDNGLIGLHDRQQGERQENIVLLQPTTLKPLPYYAVSFSPEDISQVPSSPRPAFDTFQSSSFGVEGLIPVSGKVPKDWHL